MDPVVRPDIRDNLSGELTAMGVRKDLEKRLPALLDPDETVSFAGICTPAGSWLKELRDGHVFVATDRRLLLISAKYLAVTTPAEELLAGLPSSIHYRDIRTVKLRRGLLESKLDIGLGDETIHLTSMRRKGARAAAEAIRRHAPLRPAIL